MSSPITTKELQENYTTWHHQSQQWSYRRIIQHIIINHNNGVTGELYNISSPIRTIKLEENYTYHQQKHHGIVVVGDDVLSDSPVTTSSVCYTGLMIAMFQLKPVTF